MSLADMGAVRPPPVIVRNDADHTYTLDGQPVPGVTSVLDMLYDFRFVSAETLERSRDLGTKVHNTVHLFEQGVLKRKSLHAVLDNHLIQYERFKADFNYVCEATEVFVGSRKYRYAGQMDNHGLLLPQQDEESEDSLLLDVKTGDEYPAHHLQTAGYLEAAVEMGVLPSSTKRASLYLSEDGYRFRWHKGQHDRVAFISLLNVAHWRRHHG